MSLPSHISFSQLDMFQTCPKQYELRYIRNIILPPPGALVLGGAYHKGLEKDFKFKLEEGIYPPLDIVLDAFSAEFDIRNSPEVDWGIDKPSEQKDIGYSMLERYHKLVAIELEPLETEKQFEIDLGSFKLIGVIDLKLINLDCVEQKTASRRWTQDAVDSDLQSTIYSIEEFGKAGRIPNWQYHVNIKKQSESKSDIQILETTRKLEDLAWGYGLLQTGRQAIERAHQTGLFEPRGNAAGWRCSEKWCGYWDICHKETTKAYWDFLDIKSQGDF